MVLAILLGACTGTVKPTDPLVTIETSAGREFKLVIESNPTTGYHWEITGEPDPDVVRFVSRDYKPDTPQTTGSGGVDSWVFKAVGAGETTVTLGWYPPSNTSTEPAQTETFTVRVK
jgi:predicted secreted protein